MAELAIHFTVSSSMNYSLNETQMSNGLLNREVEILRNRFFVICLISAFYLCCLSVLTTLSNCALLVVLYEDPFKTFRHPPNVFIFGLALADFFTGIAVDPLFAYFYFKLYQDTFNDVDYNRTLKLAGFLSGITMNVSCLTILSLSWMLFIAITFPHRHKQLVTTKRVVACVCVIWVYSLLFSCSFLLGIPEKIIQKIDVFFNLSFTNFLVLLSYIALHISYRCQVARLSPWQIDGTSEYRRKRDQKHFVVVSLLLATCLLIFVVPVTVMWYLTLYWRPETYEAQIKATMANITIDTTLFLKFLIDPFIYAWRLPKFRQAMKAIFLKRRRASSNGAVNLTLYNLNIYPSSSKVS